MGTTFLTVFFLILSGAETPQDQVRQLALQGDAPSQYALGTEYFFGSRTRRPNPALALYWFNKAAQQHHAPSLYNLGVCHEKGWGTPVDPARGFACYTQAAQKNLKPAQLRRALLLFKGIPEPSGTAPDKYPAIPANPKQGLAELRLLAQDNYLPAQLELAKLLLKQPLQLKKDAVKIRAWLARSADTELGSVELWKLYGLLLREGWGGIPDFKKARFYFTKARSDSGALFNLAQMTEFGEGGRTAPHQALALYREAAQKGHSGALLRLGEFALAGDLVPHHPQQAVRYFEQAAQKQEPRAFFHLGQAYSYGVAVAADPARAAFNFERGARLGDRDCQYELAQILFKGRGVPANSDSALFWLKRSAAAGQEQAVRELANRLMQGRGLPQNRRLAQQLLDTLNASTPEP